jgi:adenylate cyclase, class 2
MIEVEIKSRLNSFDDVRQNMAKLGVWLENSESQMDVMFGKDEFLDEEHKLKDGSIMARIRQSGKKIVVCFKEVNKKEGELEIEFEMPDMESAKRFLEKIGFKEAFKIEKSRETYVYKKFKVALDMVKDLGKFIEVERMVNTQEEMEKARKECLELLSFLVPEAKIDNQKYGDLMQDFINKRNAEKS